MKKMIMALALIASTVAMATTDVYQLTGSIDNLPYGVVKKGIASWNTCSTAIKGTLTVDSDAHIGTLRMQIKKTGEIIELDVTDAFLSTVINKTRANVSFKAEDTETNAISLDFAGLANIKTKTTGGNACTAGTSCSKLTALKGRFIGVYDCGCAAGPFVEWDGACEIAEDSTTLSQISGTWHLALVTVDGAKYK